jgi:hypothetical protein
MVRSTLGSWFALHVRLGGWQYQQEPVAVFQSPLIAVHKFAELQTFLFRGDAGLLHVFQVCLILSSA